LSTHQHRRRGGIALGAAGVALAGSVLFAAPASAHTPNWTVDCDSVSVDLKWYSTNHTNTVTITAGGEELLSETFGQGFRKGDLALPAHSEPLEVRLVVDAGDDNGDRHDWDLDEAKTSPVCEGQETESPEPEPTPTEPTPTESETTPAEEPSESAEPTPSESTSTPPVEPADDESPAPTDLAETGSSNSTPLIAGIAAAVVAAGAGLLVVARKRRSAKV
jgi:LPXTG-motif cell wall-anchored protein